jgi:hypothetical protein
MREVEFNLITPEQLIGPKSFGPRKEEAPAEELTGLRARVHEAPVAYSLKALFDSLGKQVKSELYSSFDVWIVPHRISVIRHSGLAEVTAVGCQIRYEASRKTLSIVSLLPASQFISLGRLGAKIELKMGCDLAETGAALEQTTVMNEGGQSIKLGPLAVGLAAHSEIGLNLQAEVLTPYIAAVGVGSTSCDFRFDRHKEQLFNRDIETWALVALPKRSKEIEYSIKYYFDSRVVFVPTRRESEWVRVTCRLAK